MSKTVSVRRVVLEKLHELIAVDDLASVAARFRPTSRPEVSTCGGGPPFVATSRTTLRCPSNQTEAPGLEGAVERGRIGHQRIRRSERIARSCSARLAFASGLGLDVRNINELAAHDARRSIPLCKRRNVMLSRHVGSSNRWSRG